MSKKPFEVISYDMFSTSNKESSWTMGDFNMDGIPELVSASSEKVKYFTSNLIRMDFQVRLSPLRL